MKDKIKITDEFLKEFLMKMLTHFDYNYQQKHTPWHHSMHQPTPLVTGDDENRCTYEDLYQWIIMDANHRPITNYEIHQVITRGPQLNHNVEVLIMKNNP
jgi:hypothetical protein